MAKARGIVNTDLWKCRDEGIDDLDVDEWLNGSGSADGGGAQKKKKSKKITASTTTTAAAASTASD